MSHSRWEKKYHTTFIFRYIILLDIYGADILIIPIVELRKLGLNDLYKVVT